MKGKDALVMMLGEKPPGGMAEKKEGSGHGDVEVGAADMMDAMKSGNVKKLASAFRSMMTMCSHEEE